MFSIKRSAATLGVVVTGLLAAAVPASAGPKAPTTATADAFLIDFTNTGVKTPRNNSKAVVVLIGANDYGFAAEAQGTQIGIED
jgi:hypothetical protein